MKIGTTEARREALELCLKVFGERMYEEQRSVWVIVFDNTERDRICVMQKVPDDYANGMHKLETSARAVAAFGNYKDKAEMLSFMCARPQPKENSTYDNGELKPEYDEDLR